MNDEKMSSYTREELKALPSESDWERAAKMTDEEIEASDALDPDMAGIDDDWLADAIVRGPGHRVHAPIDDDIIDYFKQLDDDNYLARINAILRAYMESHSRSGN